MLFSENEFREIFERSLVTDADDDPKLRERKFKDCYDKLLKIYEGIGCDTEAEFMFGERKPCNPMELPFVFFFNAVRHHFSGLYEDGFFLPEAFSQWESSFYEALSQLFGSFALEEVRKLAGNETLPTMDWMNEKALPVIADGRLFYSMAHAYPIYARQVVIFTWLMIRHTEEVIDAVCNELKPAWPRLFGDKPFKKIRKICASASDRHNGGKSVHKIEFEDGSCLIYKPHHTAIDNAFYAWISWLAGEAGEHPFVTPVTVETKSGAFCEFVESYPLAERKEAADYFRRAGFLMGAIYLLKGNDLHCENIISRGSEPVIVDMETVISPPGCLLFRMAGGKRAYTVSAMSLFPLMLPLPGFREAGFAGLCQSLPWTSNLPTFEGNVITGNGYTQEICSGFEKALRTVLYNREQAVKTVVDLFENCPMRMVVRPTSSYMKILTGLSTKEPQSDPARYRELVERKLFYENELLSHEECVTLMQKEQKELDLLDIPFFEEVPDRESLYGLAEEWNVIDDSLIENEKMRIRFSLKGVRPDAGADSAVTEYGSDGKGLSESLACMADRLTKLFDLSIHCAAVSREQRYYILSDIPLMSPAVLEGNLGTLIALSSYKRIFGTTALVEKAIDKAVKILCDPVGSAAALTARELGLADGTAGYILGCLMCYRMETLTAEQLEKTLGYVGYIAKKELQLSYGETGTMYGNMGMLYAIGKIPEEFKTDDISLIYDRVLNCIRSKQEYRESTEEKIINAVRADMIHTASDITPDLLIPCSNNSLRFGNAGRLYRAAEVLIAKEDQNLRKRADDLSRYLALQEHIAVGEEIPADCIETGLFHGMPGVLYSICRYLRPDIIPSL
ncbi:MAG: DUF4135 domain-containing protein [Lachnospiraceae bacterium]|nr:DUF4135 domain-containing protein [Lachnospiraceae bacterium]